MTIPLKVPTDTPTEADDDALAIAVEQGIQDADSGRLVPYEDVRRWLMSWGQPDEDQTPQR